MNYNDKTNSQHSFMGQNKAESYLNQLNNYNYKENNEEIISTKGNLNKEDEYRNIEDINSIKENTFNNNNNNNHQNNPNIIPQNSYIEKIKDNNSITNSNTDYNKKQEINNNNNINTKKNPLATYLQSGYKKYPHVKNNRYLIQHYKFWEGNNYFPYSGHIIEGPCAFRPTMATGLAVIVPVILFIIFNADFINETWTKAILIIAGVICLLVLIFLIISSFRDPGILRRNHFSRLFLFERRATKIVHLGFLRSYKYCGTCSKMWRKLLYIY